MTRVSKEPFVRYNPDASAVVIEAETYRVNYDGFVGTKIGAYRTREGRDGVVLQQVNTKVVHVYGVNRVAAAGDEAKKSEGGPDADGNVLWEALEDCRTHRDAWHRIIENAMNSAPVSCDDECYLAQRVLLAVFDRVFEVLSAGPEKGKK